MTAGLYLVLYAVGRFIIEYFRGDEARGFLFGLSTSQFISIFMMIAGLIVIYVSRNKEKKAG
jgi:phosphatidylglycerol:prolipoprotein diacylglycerol transferase